MLDDIADGLHAVPGVTVTVEAPEELTVISNPGLLERILDNQPERGEIHGQRADHLARIAAAPVSRAPSARALTSDRAS